MRSQVYLSPTSSKHALFMFWSPASSVIAHLQVLRLLSPVFLRPACYEQLLSIVPPTSSEHPQFIAPTSHKCWPGVRVQSSVPISYKFWAWAVRCSFQVKGDEWGAKGNGKGESRKQGDCSIIHCNMFVYIMNACNVLLIPVVYVHNNNCQIWM